MFEKDHIYILSRLFSAGHAKLALWQCGKAWSLVVHTVELSFLSEGPQVEKGSHAVIIGAGDRRQETA